MDRYIRFYKLFILSIVMPEQEDASILICYFRSVTTLFSSYLWFMLCYLDKIHKKCPCPAARMYVKLHILKSKITWWLLLKISYLSYTTEDQFKFIIFYFTKSVMITWRTHKLARRETPALLQANKISAGTIITTLSIESPTTDEFNHYRV